MCTAAIKMPNNPFHESEHGKDECALAWPQLLHNQICKEGKTIIIWKMGLALASMSLIYTMFQMYVGIVRPKPPSNYLVMFNICVLSCLQTSANRHLDNKAGHALHLDINLHAAHKCIAVNQVRLSVAKVHHIWLIEQLWSESPQELALPRILVHSPGCWGATMDSCIYSVVQHTHIPMLLFSFHTCIVLFHKWGEFCRLGVFATGIVRHLNASNLHSIKPFCVCAL